jgi:hypothetical protein
LLRFEFGGDGVENADKHLGGIEVERRLCADVAKLTSEFNGCLTVERLLFERTL